MKFIKPLHLKFVHEIIAFCNILETHNISKIEVALYDDEEEEKSFPSFQLNCDGAGLL